MFASAQNAKQSQFFAFVFLILCQFCAAPSFAGAKAKTSVADLRYGVSLYNYYQQDYLAALAELMVADARNGIQGHGNNPELIAGGISLAFGMEHHAEAVFLSILQDETRPQSVRDAAWFYLGKLQYLRGDWASAEASFARVSADFKPGLRAHMQSLLINIRIHQHKLDAVDIAELKKESLGNWSAYAFYNLGAAKAREGDFKTAQSYFRELSNIEISTDPLRQREQWALQDKAHTAMGYTYLAQKSYAGAIDEFTKVRLTGAFANQALLGYGWAAVAQEEYAKALKPWQILRQRSLIYPAVQESLLALPYAYEKLEAKGEAIKAYQAAETILTREINLVQEMRSTLTQDELLNLVGSEPVSAETLKNWSKQSAEDDSGIVAAAVTDDGQNWLKLDSTSIIKTRSAYLSELFAQNEFQSSVLQLRDLLRLQKLLRAWQPKLEIYQSLLLAKQEARAQQEQMMAEGSLTQRQEQLIAERERLYSQIQRITAEEDYIALADDDTRELYARVTQSQQTLARMVEDGRDVSEEKMRVRMFGGILLWRAAQEFPAKLAELTLQMQKIDETLSALKNTRDHIDTILATSLDIQPKLVRTQVLAKDVEANLARTSQLINDQARVLQQQVDKKLADHEKRLTNYLAQSHLAVARLYDAELRKATP